MFLIFVDYANENPDFLVALRHLILQLLHLLRISTSAASVGDSLAAAATTTSLSVSRQVPVQVPKHAEALLRFLPTTTNDHVRRLVFNELPHDTLTVVDVLSRQVLFTTQDLPLPP